MDNSRIAGISVVAWVLLATQSMAAPLPVGGNISVEECGLLVEPVQLFVSKSVKATYICNEPTGVIGYATCHVRGRRHARLSDGSETTTGIVYSLNSDRDGGRMLDSADCPTGETPIPDSAIDVGTE